MYNDVLLTNRWAVLGGLGFVGVCGVDVAAALDGAKCTRGAFPCWGAL